MTKPPILKALLISCSSSILVMIFLPLMVVSDIPASEKGILLSLKRLWISGKDSYMESWVSSSSSCENWLGIRCSSSGATVTQINLSIQDISGEIPPFICDLKNLTILNLSYNKIGGEFPTFLYNCSYLRSLDLSDNLLVGLLPNDLHRLSSQLQDLDLSFNKFSGQIPSSIVQLKGLTTLSLSSNEFNGTIPSEIWNLVNLQKLFLDYNPFSPLKLPTQFGGLQSLVTLHMVDCNLIGQIPESFANLSSLQDLSLSHNNLVGEIPFRLFLLKNLSSLDLSSNQLSGELPAVLGSLTNLEYLVLSSNNFSGPIPPELGWLTLYSLDLSFNKFSGKIPSEFDHVPHSYASWYNFRENPSLCSNNKTFELRRCSSINFSRTVALILLPIAAAMLLVILYLVFSKVIIPQHQLKRRKKHNTEQPSWIMTPFYTLNFTEASILSGLTENNVIGCGGSGEVYGINIDESISKVAVKRLRNNRKLDFALEKQFEAEVKILGKIRHINIVKLLCCISRANSMLLVYEYMENQSLDRWLHRNKRTPESSDVNSAILDWPTRLRVAIGAAKGLCYMHHDCSPPFIHRDVKTSNILLDSEFNAKIADFGLAKMSANKAGEPHTASVVAGTVGYIAPEYWRTRRLNEKIDIYSFGVVLLELATGKEPCKGNDHLNLADWSWKHYCEDRPIADALDNEIREHCFLEEITKVFKIGLMCTNAVPSSRPSMKRVLQMLVECSHDEVSADQSQTRDNEDGVAPFLGGNSA